MNSATEVTENNADLHFLQIPMSKAYALLAQ